MADLKESLTKEKIAELESFLHSRFQILSDLRTRIDEDIIAEIESYNNFDKLQEDQTEDWEERINMPLIYSAVQTAKAKLMSELFAVDNYIKIYVEDPKLRILQEKINLWVQKEVDKTGLDRLAKDFLEEALVQRVSWVHLRAVPVVRNKYVEDQVVSPDKGYKVDIQTYKFIDVWFDTRVNNVMKTDFFVRKNLKLWEVLRIDAYNIDKKRVLQTSYPESLDMDSGARKKEYAAKHSSAGASRNNSDVGSGVNEGPNPEVGMTDAINTDVEIMEYMGVIDIGSGDISDPEYEPDLKEVIITWANRSCIISVQENDIKTSKKRLLFPIRPLRQANSLIGKGIPQLTKDMQHLYNRYESLSHQNAINLVKGTVFYDSNSEIDIDEMFMGGGNMIPVDGSPQNAIYNYPHPNVLGVLQIKSQQQKDNVQQAIGTVDVITGAGGNIPETASGQRSLTEEANFKFMMMGENVADDISDIVKYIIILLIHYDKDNQALWNPEVYEFLNQDVKMLEDTDSFDIGLKDLTSRRDVEQNQWANLVTMLAPILSQTGGDVSLLVSHLMDVFQVPDKEAILRRGNPQEIATKLNSDPNLAQQVMAILAQMKQAGQTSGGGSEQNAPAVPDGTAVEKAANENLET